MRALLISHNDEYKVLLEKLFKANFSKISFTAVENLEMAIEDITNRGDIEFVFIDVNDKKIGPRELADEISEIVGSVNKIFLGNDINITSRAYQDKDIIEEVEEESTLITPIQVNHFKDLIKRILDKVEEENFANSIFEEVDDNFLPMRLRNFYMYDVIPYDAYLKLTKKKYSLVLQQGKSYSHTFIYNYAKKQVRYFYLNKDDHVKAMEQMMEQVCQDLKTKSEQAELIKTQIQAISLIQEYLNLVGITDQIILMTKIVIVSVKETFKRVKSPKAILNFIDFKTNNMAQRSYLTYKICDNLIKGMGWDAEITKSKLVLASIIHDCTLPNEDMSKISDLADPNLSFFTPQEQEKYRKHPQEAAKLAFYFNDIPEVDFIIGQHHELPDGSGFPNKLNGHTITAMSAIFILANNFVSELYRTNVNKDAFKGIVSKFKRQYDRGNFKEPLRILFDLIKYDLS